MFLRSRGRSWIEQSVATIAVAALYVVFTRIGFALAFANTQVSPVWPPEGFAFAVLLLRGRGSFWGVFLGALVGNYINLPDLAAAIAIGLANSLGALVNVSLVGRFIGGAPQLLNRVRHVVWFNAVCTPFGSALSATLGVGSLYLRGYVAPADVPWAWVTWWFGEMQGYLIVGTALVVWFGRLRPKWPPRQWGELVMVTIALAVVSVLVFRSALPLTYVPIPFFIWSAFRFRHQGASVAIVLLSSVATIATVSGSGPFAITGEGGLELNDSLILLQTYLFFLSLTAFILVATVTELEESESQKEKMETELAVAREIQMSMIPAGSLERDDCSLHAVLRPAKQVSGDFYDCFFVDDDRLCVIVGDVSGKGVPAALFMARTTTLLRSLVRSGGSIGSVVTRANSVLCDGNEQAMFVTVFAAILDLRTGALAYTNAGHNPSYRLTTHDAAHRLEERHGPVVGVRPRAQFQEGSIALAPGDALVAYTDGVTEAQDREERFFSDQRLTDLLSGVSDRNPQSVVTGIMSAVERFENGAEPADDTTILVLTYRGRAES